jgi:triosephosphate isomerase
MRFLIGANLKMNKTLEELKAYLEELSSIYRENDAIELMIAPTPAGLETAARALLGTSIHLGAQNMHSKDSGAYTGETSPLILRELGCTYVILGHSERRTLLGETDTMIAEKVSAAIAHGIRPILCIGETLEEKESGQTKSILRNQLSLIIGHIPMERIDIAYEPLWAIGTGLTPTTDEIADIHAYISDLIQSPTTRIIYG